DGSSIVAYLRTSNDGEIFGEWIRTTAERDMGRNGVDAEETFAALVGVGKTDFAQAKIEFISEKGISPKLKSLAFTFLNSEDESEITRKLSFVPRSAAYGVGTAKTSPNGQDINVISREDWGADESYRDAGDESEEWPRSYHGTRKLIVHHTADVGSNGVTNLETNKATVRSIYYYHAVTKGWGDIGYNALVDGDGNIYEGRYGTHGEDHTRSNPSADEIMVLDVDAGHVSSYNSGSFGISAMGNFTSFDVPTTQLTALKEALAFVADSRGIYADGNSDFRRYDGAWHYGLRNVSAHRDAGQTACPGDKLYLEMTGIRTYIDNLTLPNLANFSATANLISAGGAGGDNVGPSTVVLSWSQFSDAAEYQYALEKVVGITGVASTSQPWEVAWLNSENPNMATTSGTSVSIGPNDLEEESNYVFYVRAIDDSGTPTSSVSHVNFIKDENNTIIDNLSDRYTSIVSG
ncbi:MAG: N-acetylmuramoyl-L-alanine amidase, partial [Candidatus Pacebacteria bacterium]|nr:N-acetylmuramoyl-L-alanine amidase [Candidatus Paceibacterota bacterium]